MYDECSIYNIYIYIYIGMIKTVIKRNLIIAYCSSLHAYILYITIIYSEFEP